MRANASGTPTNATSTMTVFTQETFVFFCLLLAEQLGANFGRDAPREYLHDGAVHHIQRFFVASRLDIARPSHDATASGSSTNTSSGLSPSDTPIATTRSSQGTRRAPVIVALSRLGVIPWSCASL